MPTLTQAGGKPIVTHVKPIGPVSADELLIAAASVEARSEHPSSAAIVNEAQHRLLTLQTAFEQRVTQPVELQQRVRDLEQRGQTVTVVYRRQQWRRWVVMAGIDKFHAGLMPEDKVKKRLLGFRHTTEPDKDRSNNEALKFSTAG